MRRIVIRVLSTGAMACVTLFLFVCGLELATHGAGTAAAVALPSAGSDLVAEISLGPAAPGVGQETTISITVRNVGTTSTAPFFLYLYVDPADRPPGSSTPDTYYWQLPGLGPGGSSLTSRTHTFTSAGCDHVIYAWVDRFNTVSESDKNNNLATLPVCVGVQCQEDSFEADDSCATASWSSSGTAQDRTLCPVGDTDWIKFTATGGVTYTVAATDPGIHADPLVALYTSCSALPQFGSSASFVWAPPVSGVYYAQVRHRSSSYGPLANYRFQITAAATGDLYEPDDTCASAREIASGGVRQTHLFQAPGDHDWVKFSVSAGDNFAIVADHTAPGVSPLISVYESCQQAFAPPIAQGNQVQTSAATAQTYYAEVVNQNAAVYGAQASYDLSVGILPCAADPYEDDDTVAAAQNIAITGAAQTHNTCPAGDEDWVRFAGEAGTVYVLRTSNLAAAGDTDITLYDTNGTTELAHNDDYGYRLSSRIVWNCKKSGTYYARVRHHNPGASGIDTRYDLSISKGQCNADALEGSRGDNGAGDASSLITNGQAQQHNLCPGGNPTGVSDQDWVRFEAVGGAKYQIQTAGLGPDCDTVVEVYDRNGASLLASNDDYGPGPASELNFTAPRAGTYYVRVRQYNTTHVGDDTNYGLSINGAIPPTATPSPTPSPTVPPPPTATPPPTHHKTLILVNRDRVADLYGAAETDSLMARLNALADDAHVAGAVVQVEDNPAVASAYSAWTASQSSLAETAKANAAASAVRNLALTFLNNSPQVRDIIIVGDDRVIPYRRIPEGQVQVAESSYAVSLTLNTTTWAAVHDNMILTDDFYADREPTLFEGHEIYIPDYAIGRLIETPAEMRATIDTFLAGSTVPGSRALVTGYDFVADTGVAVGLMTSNDSLATNDSLIGSGWHGSALRSLVANTSPPFNLQSLNGHANHTALGAPDGDALTAAEVSGGTADLRRSVVFSVACHAGLNDSGQLDLPQAFTQKGAAYVGNTGYGWGGNGVIYSEKLMTNFAYNLLAGTKARLGEALAGAKRRYYQTEGMNFSAYDEKAMMEAVFYGIPLYEITTSATLDPGDPFPGVVITTTPPSAFGPIATGSLSFGLAGSFGALDETTTGEGTYYALNDSVSSAAGEPVQPQFYTTLAAAPGGVPRGALFLGGTYTDVDNFDPVVVRPLNEYAASSAEPAFAANGWYPAVPFRLRPGGTISATAGSMVALLGQYNSGTQSERLFDQMSFATYFSGSEDTMPPTISRVDGVLDPGSGGGALKVEASDESGILRVVVAYTDGQGVWRSHDLTYSEAAHKWTAAFTAAVGTEYFIQVVDGAGNVAVDDNKGGYYIYQAPLPLVAGRGVPGIYAPLIFRKGG